MSYTDEQKRIYNTKDLDARRSLVVLFDNDKAGKKGILASGPNGPWTDRDFEIDGDVISFQAVACEVPQVTQQDPTSTDVGQLRFGRIGSETRAYLTQIKKNSVTPSDALIRVTIAQFDGIYPAATQIFRRDMYAGGDGVTMDQNNVTITLSVDNPAKSQIIDFYDPAIYTGLVNG